MSDQDVVAGKGATAQPSRLGYWRTLVSYQGALMGGICALVTLSLLLADNGTQKGIADRQMEDRLASLEQVMPSSLYDNNPVLEAVSIVHAGAPDDHVTVYPARKQGRLVAAAFQITTIGYGGVITLMMGVESEGNILGVRVLSHKETPGLADKIELAKSLWITRFTGLSLANTSREQWAVKKDGGMIDQFSGATITPRAVVKGIHEGLLFFQENREVIVHSLTTSTPAVVGEKS